jgi:hypothetical protein
MRSGSGSAAQLGDGAQHSFACALVVVLDERVRAEDRRNVGSVAIPLDEPHGEAIYICLRRQAKLLPKIPAALAGYQVRATL